jgi:hypothetical protein
MLLGPTKQKKASPSLLLRFFPLLNTIFLTEKQVENEKRVKRRWKITNNILLESSNRGESIGAINFENEALYNTRIKEEVNRVWDSIGWFKEQSNKLAVQRTLCGSHDAVKTVTSTRTSLITQFSRWSWCTRPWTDFCSKFQLVFEKKGVGIKAQVEAVITIATLAILMLNSVAKKHNWDQSTS